MGKIVDELKMSWESRLYKDCPHADSDTWQSIVRWLLGEDCDRLDRLTANELVLAKPQISYRYRILQQRYLNIDTERAYRHLLTRLGALIIQRYQILSGVELTHEHQQVIVDNLQALIQEMLHQDTYLQQQMRWIAQCTQDACLRNTLLFASLEEYCLRPVHNQPLIIKHFVNFMRHQLLKDKFKPSQRDFLYLLLAKANRELADFPQIAESGEIRNWEKQHGERIAVQQVLENYLAQKVGMLEVRWLRLYLQGRSQEAIASILNVPLRQVYRLRETVNYHALEVFLRQRQLGLTSNFVVNGSA